MPLHLLSGRGHHFVWRVRKGSAAFVRLAQLGRLPATLAARYEQPQPPHGEPVGIEDGHAFAGLGLVMEYVAHRVKALAAPHCKVPVELSAVEVGPTERGREMISLDISEYGDPLHVRVIRVPFGLYLKPWQQRAHFGPEVVAQLPPVFMIPLHEMSSTRGIKVMHEIESVLDLATRASTRIPDQSEGVANLVAAYERSELARFHGWFYAQEHEPPAAWPQTYDRTPLDALPPCARHTLEYPNDLLLRPSGLRLVTRSLLALGWHPRHIAGLFRSKFERDYGWNAAWQGYDPAARADFYTRMFSGLFATGGDDLVDFNCVSAQEARVCTHPERGCDLHDFRQSLLDRRTHERLAHRPFNRLFLPHEHL